MKIENPATKHDVTTAKLAKPKLRTNLTAGRYIDPDADPFEPPVRPYGDPAV